MNEYQFIAESFPYWKALVWSLYPMTVLVLFELFLRASGDDDDDDPEGGIMTPVYQGT